MTCLSSSSPPDLLRAHRWLVPLLGLLAAFSLHAQVAPNPGTSPAPAARGAARTSPSTAEVTAAPGASGKDDDTIILSPFAVNAEKDRGFAAVNAGTATKLGLDMKDMAAPYSVMTAEFLQTVGINNLQDAVTWSTNGSPVVDGQGADQFNAPVMYNVRGALQNVGQQRNFFSTASVGDTYNTERIDFGRGPNAVLFNTGASDVLGGGVSVTTKRARLDRNFETVAFTVGSWSNYRSTIDVNRVLTSKLALRANAVWEDKGGWYQNQFQKTKGVTVTGTYRLTPKTELRLEGESTIVRRSNPVITPLDNLSGWDGVTVFNGPISNPMLSTTATPGSVYGLTFNGEPQGVERIGTDYVYIPGDGSIENWVNMARTRRGDATSRTPLYSGGQTWTRNGNALLLPFGNASNQSTTPGILDNGATNGPTILYSTDLPGDRFDRAIANSKFRIPGKQFTNMPSDPLFTQWFRDANFDITHQFTDNLYVEVMGDYNKAHNHDINNINGFRTTFIDLNRNLPDGSPNPHFLDVYGQGQERYKDFYMENGQVRAVVNYIKDLGKWGSYTFNLSGSSDRRETDGRQSVASIAIAADPREWQGQAISTRIYWNTSGGSVEPSGGLPTKLVNPVLNTDGTYASSPSSSINPAWVLNSWDDATQLKNSGIFAMAGRWFHNRLVVTAGVRDDSFRTKVRQSLRIGSLPNDPNWKGQAIGDAYWRADAPKDWLDLTYIPVDATGKPTSAVPITAATRPTVAGPNGVNQPDPRYAAYRFRDDYNNPDRTGHAISKTLGATGHVFSWLSVKGNYGTNFALRAGTDNFLDGTPAKPEQGLAYEGALVFSLFHGNLAITPRYYWNRRDFRLGDPPTTAPINALMGRNEWNDGSANSRNKLGFTDVLGKDFFSTLNTGYEVEIVGTITRGWRVSASLGTAQAKDYNRWINTPAYVKARADEFRQVLERAGGKLDTTAKNPTSASAPGLAIADPAVTDAMITAAGGSTSERTNAVIDYNNIWTNYDLIPQIKDTLNTKKLNWKLVTDYTIQKGPFKGFRAGLAVNFVDQNLVGYRSADTLANPNYDATKPVTATNLPYIDDPNVDLSTPIWFKLPIETTGIFGYTVHLTKGPRFVRGKQLDFGLRIRNLMNWQMVVRQDTGIALRPKDGDLSQPNRVSVASRIGAYQIPRSFEFTTTLRL